MFLNYQKGDKVLFKGKGRSNEAHFHAWARKPLKPNTILTLLNLPSNNGFCMAATTNEDIVHINVITDEIEPISKKDDPTH